MGAARLSADQARRSGRRLPRRQGRRTPTAGSKTTSASRRKWPTGSRPRTRSPTPISQRFPSASHQEAAHRAVELREVLRPVQGRRPLLLQQERRPAEPERSVHAGRARRRAARAARPEQVVQGRHRRPRRRWPVSDDGKTLAYGVAEAGSDWRTWNVLDVATGKQLDDEVKWVKFSDLSWTHDGKGFFYSRFPEPKKGEKFQSPVAQPEALLPPLGTPQSRRRARLPAARPPDVGLSAASVTEDGQYLVIDVDTAPRAARTRCSSRT